MQYIDLNTYDRYLATNVVVGLVQNSKWQEDEQIADTVKTTLEPIRKKLAWLSCHQCKLSLDGEETKVNLTYDDELAEITITKDGLLTVNDGFSNTPCQTIQLKNYNHDEIYVWCYNSIKLR